MWHWLRVLRAIFICLEDGFQRGFSLDQDTDKRPTARTQTRTRAHQRAFKVLFFIVSSSAGTGPTQRAQPSQTQAFNPSPGGFFTSDQGPLSDPHARLSKFMRLKKVRYKSIQLHWTGSSKIFRQCDGTYLMAAELTGSHAPGETGKERSFNLTQPP